MRKKQQATPQRLIWIGAVIGVLLLVAGGIMLWNGLGKATTIPLQVTGAPRLAVDQTTIDEGDVKLNKTIRSAFRIQNVGDQPLQILGEPQVEVVEGC
jgi:hypothetical protein